MPDIEFDSLATAGAWLDGLLHAATVTTDGPFTVGQAISHCAQSLEDTMDGYPQLRSAAFRLLLGPLVLHWFLARKVMSHNRAEPIPGAPAIPPETTREQGITRLRAAIHRFQSYTGPLAPHFVYGVVDKSQYDRIQAMHMADHFSQFQLS